MAAPHVAGTIALILSARARPARRPDNYDAVTDAVRVDRDRPHRRLRAAATRTATRTTSTATAGSTPRPRSTSWPRAARSSGTVTDVDTNAAIAGATRDRERRRRASSAPSPTRTATTTCSSRPGTYVVTATAFGYAAGDRVRRRRSRPTRRPTRTSQLDALPRFTVTGHVRASEDGSPIADASVRAIGTPVPAGDDGRRPAPTSLELPIGDYTLPRVGRRLHRAGRGRHQPRRRRTSPRTSRCSASSTTSATAAARSRSTGSTRPSQTALYGDEFVGRLHLPFDFDVLRRDLLPDLAVRQRLRELPRPRPVQLLPVGDPVGEPAERRDLRALAGPRRRRTAADRLRDRRLRARTGPSSSSTRRCRSSGRRPTSRFEIKLWEDGTDRPAVRQQPGQPG